MQRLINAFRNSLAALHQLGSSEAAFQQELFMLALSVPVAFYFWSDGWMRLTLIGAIVFVMIVEVLNTGIEAACNALSRDFNADIKIAKDCGSLAVLMSMGLAFSVWAVALWRIMAN